jgi:hypothetical protein
MPLPRARPVGVISRVPAWDDQMRRMRRICRCPARRNPVPLRGVARVAGGDTVFHCAFTATRAGNNMVGRIRRVAAIMADIIVARQHTRAYYAPIGTQSGGSRASIFAIPFVWTASIHHCLMPPYLSRGEKRNGGGWGPFHDPLPSGCTPPGYPTCGSSQQGSNPSHV